MTWRTAASVPPASALWEAVQFPKPRDFDFCTAAFTLQSSELSPVSVGLPFLAFCAISSPKIECWKWRGPKASSKDVRTDAYTSATFHFILVTALLASHFAVMLNLFNVFQPSSSLIRECRLGFRFLLLIFLAFKCIKSCSSLPPPQGRIA